MQDAAPHWLPPIAEAMSHWYTSAEEARAFLDEHPEIRAAFWQKQNEEEARRTRAKRALETMAEMADIPYDSVDWQEGGSYFQQTLEELAA